MSRAPTLTIVVVNHNTRSDLNRCIRSLHEAPPSTPHGIVVVDNASSDGSADHIRATWPDVEVIEMARNVGFAAGNNRGIQSTTGDLLLLLNSDTVVPAGAVDLLVDGLRMHPDTAAIGPRIVDGEGRAELSFGAMCTPWTELKQKLVRRLVDRGTGAAVAWVERVTRRPAVVDWVTGACLLVWREDAEAVGLLDDRYFMYYEDVDFCEALRARRRRIRFLPGAQIVHFRGRTAAVTRDATEAAYRRSQLAFYAKHHPRWLPWLGLYLRLSGKYPGKSADTTA
jgi:hypothetical protein